MSSDLAGRGDNLQARLRGLQKRARSLDGILASLDFDKQPHMLTFYFTHLKMASLQLQALSKEVVGNVYFKESNRTSVLEPYLDSTDVSTMLPADSVSELHEQDKSIQDECEISDLFQLPHVELLERIDIFNNAMISLEENLCLVQLN